MNGCRVGSTHSIVNGVLNIFRPDKSRCRRIGVRTIIVNLKCATTCCCNACRCSGNYCNAFYCGYSQRIPIGICVINQCVTRGRGIHLGDHCIVIRIRHIVDSRIRITLYCEAHSGIINGTARVCYAVVKRVYTNKASGRGINKLSVRLNHYCAAL